MQPAHTAETASFAEWHHAFVDRRLGILMTIGFLILATYLVADLTFGQGGINLRYRAVTVAALLLTLAARRTPLARHRLGVDLMILVGICAVTFSVVSLSAAHAREGLLTPDRAFYAVMRGVTLVIVTVAVVIPARWPTHAVIQAATLGWLVLAYPHLISAVVPGGSAPIWSFQNFLWICIICDVSILMYTRLQRSEFEARRELLATNRELEDVARQRTSYLDGLVRVGISATATNPDDQARAALDEMIQLLGAERAFLYLAAEGGRLRFRAGRSSARADLAPPGTPPTSDAIVVPLQVREHHLGQLVLEKSGGEASLSEADRDFLGALASHAAIALETVCTTEELTLARDQALEAGRAKDAFLKTMSHELRTPLNAMIGYSEMLTEDLEDAGDNERAGDARKVHEAAGHLLGIIADILELTKLEADRSAVVCAPFSVEEAVRSVEMAVRPAAERSGDRLEVSAAADVGTMNSERARVELILRKLLENACKFTRSGEVTLRAQRQASNGDEIVVFQVSDTGIGMTEEQLARCFEPFYQADPSATREYGGTGLGLTTAIRVCELLGGSLTAKSSPGKGSHFEVRLAAG